ncbi:MAG: hypothetical protein AB1353_08305 [Aquificota bacterium]|jgi:hypothetical protein|nr:hypothetical protein [Aquificaceae bacterium]MDM7266813.1 hypothetical protein [Aquificaceae bacterium]QWK13550.1 MAG: DUF4911 domain-containing protein [Aquificota bacterium]HAV40011.1 hypothetical protein [Aquificaceae bacterium]HCO38473.1 hypothetical protein [Aquificaceae bacterium]
MSKEIRARVLLVRVPKRYIGLFTALMDGAGRKAIVRTKEKSSDEVYLIATPDTFEDLYPILENIKRHIPLEIVGEVSHIDVG